LTYQWDFTVGISSGRRTRPDLDECAGTQAGTYRVRITNPLGTVISSSATLTVLVRLVHPATGEPDANLAWERHDIPALGHGHSAGELPVVFQPDQTSLANQTNSSLALTKPAKSPSRAVTRRGEQHAATATSLVAVLTVFRWIRDAPETLGYPPRRPRWRAASDCAGGLYLGSTVDYDPTASRCHGHGDDLGEADDEGWVASFPLMAGQIGDDFGGRFDQGLSRRLDRFHANGTGRSGRAGACQPAILAG